ncbi:MAG: ATP-binding cassette domain-containing protein [Pseudomonadota bacterium]
MPAPEIAFDAVGVTYPGGTVAVDRVTIDIAAGSFVALVGQSGSGKSTLLKTVNRLVAPTTGIVRIDGRAVSDEPAYHLRRRIGYVFQGVGLFPHLSVAQNIAMPLRLAGISESGRIGELLDLVELPRGVADRRPDALSGGQRQRVGVARALAAGAKLLLMDEPFGALDPVTRDTLGTRVKALHGDLGLTTLMVTHDMAEALLLANRVLVMQAGRIVADATPAELLAGGGGDAAQALVDVPRRQMRALEDLAR